jgi:hypothetical protein
LVAPVEVADDEGRQAASIEADQINNVLATCDGTLSAADAASVARLYATAGSKGAVSVLEPDLTPREEHGECFVSVREAGGWRARRCMFNQPTAA